MDPFRVYFKVKIKDESTQEYLQLIPSYIAIIKQSEPHVLQFEGFYNEEKATVVWLHSYKDAAGFDKHLANPLLKDSMEKMMSMQETSVDFYLFGQPTNSTIDSFSKM